MENIKNEKDYAEYNHDNKTVRFGGKPAIIVSVFAGVTLVGLTYIMTRNPEATKDIATKVLMEVTKHAA